MPLEYCKHVEDIQQSDTDHSFTAPYQGFLGDEWKNQMALIQKCSACGHCKNHCPYGLDTPTLLKEMLSDYQDFYASHQG